MQAKEIESEDIPDMSANKPLRVAVNVIERGLHYRGLGHIAGIPARDLTPEEVEQYGGLEYLLSRENGHGGKMFEKMSGGK